MGNDETGFSMIKHLSDKDSKHQRTEKSVTNSCSDNNS